MDSVLTVERDGYVATVWLDRPDKLNAMGPAFWEQLPQVMGELGEDDQVRVVVIAGKGRAFTVGLDLAAYGSGLADLVGVGSGSEAAKRKALLATIKEMQASITAVADCPKPVIAAVHGYTLGGGIDLITACDVRIAAADALLSVRETKMAMVADLGTMQRLPKIVSPGRVAELVYTGRDVTADDALEFGLIDHVYPDQDTAVKAAHALAAEIAANSPLAVQGAKAVLKAGEGRTVAEALDYVAVWNAAMLESSDLMEAMQAFIEKRPPDFKGG